MAAWMALQYDGFMAATVTSLAVIIALLSEHRERSLALAVLGMVAHGMYSTWAARRPPPLSLSPGVIRLLLTVLVLPPLIWSCGPHQPTWIAAVPAFIAGPLTSKLGRESLALVLLLAATLAAHAAAGASSTSLLTAFSTLSAAGVLSSKASQVLNSLVEESRAATEAKSRFLANMSHELRTPLAGVIGLTDLALGSRLDDEPRELVTTARASAQHLLGILNDILDLSKIEADRLTLEEIPFDLREVVEQVAVLLRASVQDRPLTIAVVVDAAARRVGDPMRLRQILMNLGGNAVKFSTAGVIEIAAVARDGHVRISVKDPGIGISEQQKTQLFQPFTQADVSTTRRFGGTGLGLSICRSLVQKMGGELTVDSRPGQGSTFSFEVPLPLAPAAATPDATSAPTHAVAQHPLRVLLAEDNAVNQLIVGKMLRRAGHEVRTAMDGDQVLAALETGEHFDVVLMDVQMPVRDGLDTTRVIRSGERVRCVDIPIIALTANALVSDRDDCLAAGMNAYLVKPVSAAALADALARTAA